MTRAKAGPVPDTPARDWLTAGERRAAMAKASKIAMQFAWAVSGRDAALIQRLSDELTRDELAALAIVLAAAADGHKLLLVSKTTDDGEPNGDANAA